MAVIAPITVRDNRRVTTVTWVPLTEADTTVGGDVSDMRDLTVSVAGTFGGGTTSPQGSTDGVGYFPLTKDGTTVISFTAIGIAKVFERPRFVRWTQPNTAVGASLRCVAMGSNRT